MLTAFLGGLLKYFPETHHLGPVLSVADLPGVLPWRGLGEGMRYDFFRPSLRDIGRGAERHKMLGRDGLPPGFNTLIVRAA